MTPSSLIFVVIFAVWAAYMVQHWVRRREDLATARSVDRFSEAMRMLERRTPARRDVHAHAADEPKVAVLRPHSGGASAASNDADAPREASTAAPSGVAARLPLGKLNTPAVKAGLLLSSLVFFVLTVVLAPFGIVPGWLPLLGLAAVGGVVFWLRRTAVQARAARAAKPAARPARRPVAEAEDAERVSPTVAAPKPQTEKVAATRVEHVEKVDAAQPATVVAVAEVDNDEVFDQAPGAPDMGAVARAEAEVFGDGWAPVEVPKPTYTMKAKAEREDVAPAATIDDSRPLAARYENTPVEDLPFDGMALDEDYEELPQVYRAG